MTIKRFIDKQGASNYYMVDHGMGGFLQPPEHADHNRSIQEDRGGHEVGAMSISYAARCDYAPAAVRAAARAKLKRYPGKVTEEWIAAVYKYFRHCYTPDGTDRSASGATVYGKFWDNADAERDADPRLSLAYLFVKDFDPDHAPRLDLMDRPQ